VIVHSADGVFAIRKGSHKWIEGVPADDVKPAAKKAHTAQYQRMLFDLKNDIAEEKEISAQHPEILKELEALLKRYRDGGYSRELPPAGIKPKAAFEPLIPLKKAEPVKLNNFQSSKGKVWATKDDAIFGRAGDKGSALTGPISMRDGVLEFQILLGMADRHSLRIQTETGESFRIVLSRAFLEVAKNPSKGEGNDATVPLAKTRVKFKASDWQTLRLTFRGNELTAEFVGTQTNAKHPVLAGKKNQLNFIAFDGEVGLRQALMAPLP
jgi:hypothetical protein